MHELGSTLTLLYYPIFSNAQNLQAHLDKMSNIMQVHTDRDVLETVAKTLEFLCTDGSAIFTRCDIARSNIIDQCVNRYKETLDDWKNLIEGTYMRNYYLSLY